MEDAALLRSRPRQETDKASPRREACDALGIPYHRKKSRNFETLWTTKRPIAPSADGGSVALDRAIDDAITAMRLRVAFIQASHKGHVALMEMLVAAAGLRVCDQRMALHFAADADQVSSVRYLITRGVDVNGRDSKSRSPLMYAAYKGHVAVLGDLLAQGAGVELEDDFGSTALMYAASGGRVGSCLALLDAGARINATNRDGFTPLIYAVEGGQIDAAAALLVRGGRSFGPSATARAPGGAHALHWAAKRGRADLCALLCDHGAPVDCRNASSVTPLMYAADHAAAVVATAPAVMATTQSCCCHE